jgi:predicted dehydrogenase
MCSPIDRQWNRPMTRRDPIRFGLIGAGAIAQTHSTVLQQSDRCRLVAVADVRADVAAAIAGVHHCRHFNSADALLDESNVEAVIVATPPATHADICIQALERGCHVLCEKPLAIDSATTRTILDTARRRDRQCMMASKFRYVEDMIRAKSLVASGIVGEIVLLENVFVSRVDMRSRWNALPEISGGGVLIDNGTHSVDIVRYFLGPLAEVQATEGKRVQGLPVEETVHMLLRSVDGVMASVDLSWSLNKENDSGGVG